MIKVGPKLQQNPIASEDTLLRWVRALKNIFF